MTTALPALPNIAVLSPLVTRIMGQNPGPFCLQGTNTYLVGSPSQRDRILIDTGEGFESYATLLHNYLKTTRFRLSAIVVTHWHPDHVKGVPSILAGLDYSPSVYKVLNPEKDEPHQKYTPLKDGDKLNTAGVSLDVLHTPGHAKDHVCLWLDEEKCLFTADNVLGHGTTVFEDYHAYLTSLRRMLALPSLGRLYPGHGQLVDDGPAKITEYIEHRLEREQQVIEAMQSLAQPVESMQLTKIIYGESQHPKLYAAADRGVQLYLIKLEHDGVVRESENRWTLVHGRL